MKRIVLTKKGFGTVVMIQGEYSNGDKYYTITQNGITIPLKDGNIMNIVYRQHIRNGYTVKPEEPEKTEKEPRKSAPKKTWEEHLEEQFGTKEDRIHFIEVRNRIAVTAINYFRQKYLESGAALSKEEYKKAEKKFINSWANKVIAAEAAC